MTYRKEPKTGIIFNEETVVARYIKDLPDKGVILYQFSDWEEVNVYYDSRFDTLLHIKRVAQLLTDAAAELIRRANCHDDSKLKDPEKDLFDILTPRLAGVTYGSEEYGNCLAELKPALKHHYENNSHHPEHYENGINGMDLFDIIEMFFDWKAAGERHNDGDIYKSIEINKERQKMSDQLTNIFINTATKMGW